MTGEDRGSGWWATLPLAEVEDLVDFILWDTPTSMFPTAAQVILMLTELAARDDAADPIVQAAIAQCWNFLEFEIKACH